MWIRSSFLLHSRSQERLARGVSGGTDGNTYIKSRTLFLRSSVALLDSVGFLKRSCGVWKDDNDASACQDGRKVWMKSFDSDRFELGCG